MLELADESEPEDIDPAHLPAVLEGLAQVKRGEFASLSDMEAAFRHFESRSFALLEVEWVANSPDGGSE